VAEAISLAPASGLKPSPPQTPPTDASLIEAAKRHDVHAFEALMRRYNRRLFRAARGILRDNAAAEDAVQESYIRAFTHLDRYQPTGSFGAWLTRIAINEALMMKRRNRRMLSLDQLEDNLLDNEQHSLAEWLATPDSSNAAGVRQLLERAIDELPQAFRMVFLLRAVEQLSVAETAACLEINRATVKTRMHRAQVRLRKDISQRLQQEQLTLFEFAGTQCDHIVDQVLAKLSTQPVRESPLSPVATPSGMSGAR
jgi:RNA polymerase sigma-70 factor, ECF subfamily